MGPSQGCIAPPGVKDEARNLTPTAAFFIGCGLAEQLAARFSMPTTSLRVSVRTPACHCLHVCIMIPCFEKHLGNHEVGQDLRIMGSPPRHTSALKNAV